MQLKKKDEVTTARKYAEYRREKELQQQKKRPRRAREHRWLKSPLTWAVVTVLAAAAAFGAVYFINSVGEVEPASGVSGYYSMAQTVMGEGVSGARLTGVDIAAEGEDTVVRMAFEGGIPPYTVSALNDPARVVVSMGNLSGWELSSGIVGDDQSLVLGMFRNQASGDGVTELYFQTARRIGYQLSEEGGVLVLRLRALDEAAQTGYYVTLGAYEEYCAGRFDGADLTPVLCADGASVTLISRRYDNSVEAEAFLKTINERISAALPGVSGAVVQLSGNEAPPLSDTAERTMLSAAEVYRPFEGSAAPWLWTTNARLVEWMPDMKRALFTRHTAAAAGDEEEYCELWLYDQAGKGQRLLDLEFRTVDTARFAPAGDALAFMEITDSEYLLYYYSLTGGSFAALGDSVGGDTYGFDFAQDGSLYLVGGVGQPQLTRWDPASGEARLMEDDAGLEGSFAMGGAQWSPGVLYMSDGEDTTYAFGMESGARQVLTVGGDFVLSPDGRYMALLDIDETLQVDTYTSIRLRDLHTGREQEVFSGEAIGDVCWSSGGARIYYLTYNLDAATSELFPSVLHCYDVASGQTRALGLLASSDIDMGADDSEVAFVTMYESAAGRYQFATYRVMVG